jgi:hypothetical protein
MTLVVLRKLFSTVNSAGRKVSGYGEFTAASYSAPDKPDFVNIRGLV